MPPRRTFFLPLGVDHNFRLLELRTDGWWLLALEVELTAAGVTLEATGEGAMAEDFIALRAAPLETRPTGNAPAGAAVRTPPASPVLVEQSTGCAAARAVGRTLPAPPVPGEV